MKAQDVMTWGVFTVKQDTPITQAAELMLQNNISGLPVVDDDGKMVGIVTEGDFLRRSELGTEKQRPRWLEILTGPGRLAGEYVHQSGRKVGEVMSRDPHAISETTELVDIVKQMEEFRIKRLPVVNDNGKPIGIVSRSNLLRALSRCSSTPEITAGSDRTIRDDIVAALKGKPWTSDVGVAVHNGAVELKGVITDEKTRQAIIVATENVSGVKCIHDHLVWVEPMSGMVFLSPEDAETQRAAATKTETTTAANA